MLVHKEGWAPKNWCFQIAVLEKTLGSPIDCKEIKPVKPKENQPWIFIGRSDAEAEAPICRPPDVKSWLTGKDCDAGKDWRQEKGNHRGWDGKIASPTQWTWTKLSGPQTPGHSGGQRSLVCCSLWSHKESEQQQQQYAKKQNQLHLPQLTTVRLFQVLLCISLQKPQSLSLSTSCKQAEGPRHVQEDRKWSKLIKWRQKASPTLTSSLSLENTREKRILLWSMLIERKWKW